MRERGQKIDNLTIYEGILASWYSRLNMVAEHLRPNGLYVMSVATALGSGSLLERVRRRDDRLLRVDGQIIVDISDAQMRNIEQNTDLEVIALEAGTTPQTFLASIFYEMGGRWREYQDKNKGKNQPTIDRAIRAEGEFVRRTHGVGKANNVRRTRYIAGPGATMSANYIPRSEAGKVLKGEPNRWIMGFRRKS